MKKIKRYLYLLKRNKNLRILSVVVLALLIVLITLFVKVITKRTSDIIIFDTDRLIPVEKSNKYGFINNKGKLVIDYKYDEVSNFYNGYTIVYKKDNKSNERYILIDENGKEIVYAENSADIKYYETQNCYVINNKLFDNNIDSLTDDDVKIVEQEYEKYFSYKTDSEAGIIDNKGKIIYKYEYQKGENSVYFSISELDDKTKEDLYLVINIENKKYGIINLLENKEIVKPTKKYITALTNNVFEYSNQNNYETEKYIYVKDNEILYEASASEYSKMEMENIDKNILTMKLKGNSEYKYYDLEEKKFLNDKPNLESKIINNLLENYEINECSTGFGILDSEGETVLPCEYQRIEKIGKEIFEYISDMKNKKLFVVKKDDKYGIINIRNNKYVLEPIYEEMDIPVNRSPFIKVMKDKEYKMINLINMDEMKIKSDDKINYYTNYFIINSKTYYNYKMDKIFEM